MKTGPSLHRPLPGAYVVTPRAVPPPPPIPSSLSDRSGSQMDPNPNLTLYTACFLDSGGGVQPHFSLPPACSMWLSPFSSSPTPGIFSPRPHPLFLPPLSVPPCWLLPDAGCPRPEPLQAPGGPRPQIPPPALMVPNLCPVPPGWVGKTAGPVALPGRSLPALRFPAGSGLEGDREQEVCQGASPRPPPPVWVPCVSSGGSPSPGRSLRPGACPLSRLLPTPRPVVGGSGQAPAAPRASAASLGLRLRFPSRRPLTLGRVRVQCRGGGISQTRGTGTFCQVQESWERICL